MNIKSVALDFFYKTAFNVEPPEAYERLIFDAMVGDQTLFIRGDEAEAAWAVIDPIEQHWAIMAASVLVLCRLLLLLLSLSAPPPLCSLPLLLLPCSCSLSSSPPPQPSCPSASCSSPPPPPPPPALSVRFLLLLRRS